MRKSILLLLCLSGYCCAGPLGQKKNMPIVQRDDEPMIMEPASAEAAAEESVPAQEMMAMSTLTLPSNATSIRADITDNFSCENKTYGYYADVENECQIFHVCLPVTYADGKENTFRWSFICPEETIFSQESFTCMRREDMSIDCEESYKYYELNRNFGMVEEESNKNSNSNTMSVNNEDQQTAMSMQSEQEQEQHRPIEEEKIEIVAAPVPAQVQPQPMNQKVKPVKVLKPNRRRPAQPHNTQKKPANYPLRKVAQATQTVLEATTLQPVETVQTEAEKKPVVQRFNKRPSTMSTAIKERIQPGKAETTPIRIELYNQNRKRPMHFNKKDAAIAKPTKEVAFDVAEPELTEPAPTLKIESMFNKMPIPQDAIKAIPSDDKVEPELPKSDSPASEADAETQASEIAEVLLKPEEIVQTVAEEFVQTAAAETVQETAAETVQETAEETIQVTAEETSKPEEEQSAEHTIVSEVETEKIAEQLPIHHEIISASKTEETQIPVEAIEEIPAVIIEIEDNQQASSEKQTANEEAINTAENNIGQTEEQIAADEQIVIVEAPTAESQGLLASPAIFEENSEEGAVATLAELEAQKPADAVETMPATPEMEQQDPMVQQMFEETDLHKQSMGGFKPVDPVMAAEAEALITDFLNTLRNGDTEGANPAQTIEKAEETLVDASENQEIELKNENNEKTENQEVDSIITASKNAEELEVPAITVTKVSSLEEKEKETDTALEPLMLKNAAPISNMMQMHNFPAEMYQIPVRVIETPIEETTNEEKSFESIDTVDNKPQVLEPAQMPADYMPLSIDDIVELVKERLDQVPAAEKGKPIEMVIEQTSQENPTEEEKIEEDKTAEENLVEEKPAEQQSVEEIVMPIYHRISEGDSNEIKAQNAIVEDVITSSTAEDKPEESIASLKINTEEKFLQADDTEQTSSNNETDAQVLSAMDDAKTKASRAYRSRSMKNAKMDPRKRRFLFRSDAS